MKRFNLFYSFLLLLFSFKLYSGTTATTVHSRANCYNNESITWWLFHPYNWKVVSIHISIYGDSHLVDTGFSYTWRQAAVHWGEAPLGDHRWVVNGYHYLIDYGNGRVPFDTTNVKDCNIYNGWWDY
jgi:hypothetical protein